MNNPVKISVIIPVYNVEDYLPFAMQSLIEQTLMDVEFICVNDGSTDNSLAILEKYAALDDRIVIINKENGGVSSARNAGLRYAQGSWIMFLDPDDYLAKNACERVWIESEEGPTDIINFGTDVVPKQPRPSEWYEYALLVPTRRFWEFEPGVLFDEPSTKPFIWHQAYRKEFLDESDVWFDESLTLGEDMVFLMSLYPHGQKFAFIEDRLYSYRYIRKHSAMQDLRQDDVKKLGRHINVVSKVLEHWQKHGFLKKYEHEIIAWIIDFLISEMLEADIEIEEKGALIRKLGEILDEYSLLSHVKKTNTTGNAFHTSYKHVLKGRFDG